jgi:hypothetical protein
VPVTRLGVSAGGRLSVNCSTGAVTPCCDSCPALELNLCVSGSCSTVSSSGRAAAWIYTQSRRERQYDFPNQPDLLYEWTRSVDVLRFVIDPDGASLATIGAAVAAEMSAAGITDGGYEVTGDGFLVFVTVWTNCAVSVVAESPPTYTAPSCPTGINANQSENLALGGVPNFHTLGRKSGTTDVITLNACQFNSACGVAFVAENPSTGAYATGQHTYTISSVDGSGVVEFYENNTIGERHRADIAAVASYLCPLTLTDWQALADPLFGLV